MTDGKGYFDSDEDCGPDCECGMERQTVKTAKPLDKEPFMAAMRGAKHCDGDAEIAHKMADDVLCEFLIALGHEDLVELWNDVEKWYS